MSLALASPKASSRQERERLFQRFASKITPNSHLDRTVVSVQANRRTPFYGWFKYKEGFSARLIRQTIQEMKVPAGVLLDPFAGAGTALFESRSLGWDAIGIELLPVGVYAIEARLAAEGIRAQSLSRTIDALAGENWAEYNDPVHALQHIPITERAFSRATERAISGYRAYCNKFIRNPRVRKIFEFACFCILESVSFTRKDGQYLRWDHRAAKGRVSSDFNKGPIPSFGAAIIRKLREIDRDLTTSHGDSMLFSIDARPSQKPGMLDLRCGSCLDLLPQIEDESIDLVITSPPYCNRYDYTRTYALELVYLGLDNAAVNSLRQRLLSCTVENREKIADLERIYLRYGRPPSWKRILQTFTQQYALHEVLEILNAMARQGSLNNVNIPRMVRNYFLEMSAVVHELARVVRPGGAVIMVNDNVRYGGEEVPVDLILSDFAEGFGLRVEHIWTLPRGKGNSSQQMGEHGRTELRKCVYVWRKP